MIEKLRKYIFFLPNEFWMCSVCVCMCFRIYYNSILDRILTQIKWALPVQSYELCEFVCLLSSNEKKVVPH